MGVFPVLLFLLAIIKTTLPYRDYHAPRMPDYDLDYDRRQSRTRSDYTTESIVQADDDDEDYKYDDEDDNSKPLKDLYIDDTTIPSKLKIPKTTREDIDPELYNEEELKQRSRRRKAWRQKDTEFESEVEDGKNKYGQSRNDKEHLVGKDYILKEEDYKENYEKKNEQYNRREFTNKKARRKPRDRPTKVERESEDNQSEKNQIRHKNRKTKLQRNSDNDGNMAKELLIESFDDMKRVNNFKENLPLIIRQPVNMSEFSSPSSVEVLQPRRAETVDDTTPMTPNVTDTTLTLLSLPINVTATLEVANKSELSIAERSRLSILKKVLRKENKNVTVTTKPPILMRVTDSMQTVVMVESNNLEKEIKKVRRVLDDNPESMERAKHLMRQKLVANAKSIQDLTDNWDEMVCDYIDVNLLNSAPAMTSNVYLVLYCLKLWL